MRLNVSAALFCIAFLVGGCSKSDGGNGPPTTDENYLSAKPLDGAVGVAEAKKATSDGEEITLVGRVGGSEKPFVDGLAAFTIVDPAVEHCADDEGCSTPWDYCCETDKLPENSATVKLVDASGKTLAKDAKEVLGIAELSLVTIRGTAKRDAQGNLTVDAIQVYVDKTNGR